MGIAVGIMLLCLIELEICGHFDPLGYRLKMSKTVYRLEVENPNSSTLATMPSNFMFLSLKAYYNVALHKLHHSGIWPQ